MNIEAMKKYRLTRTREMKNLKEMAGQTIAVTAWNTSEYTDPDGAVHTVLALELQGGAMYRTEVRSFIESFRDLVECFGNELPPITIVKKRSRKNNDYIDFEVLE